MKGKFHFLGTGGSMGVPMMGCSCPVCSSSHPHNKRLRSSALLEIGNLTFLIDAGPDFRQQALKRGLKGLDAVLLTHPHFDHIGGLDDLRAFYFINKAKIPCLLSSYTLGVLKQRYDYLFVPHEGGKSMPAQLDFQVLRETQGTAHLLEVPIRYFSYFQAGVPVTGFRFGSLAYVSDIREYPSDIFEALKGVETLIVSALRHTPSPMHFSLDEAVEFARRVGADQTYLTHIAHELDAENISLPAGIMLSYDELALDFKL